MDLPEGIACPFPSAMETIFKGRGWVISDIVGRGDWLGKLANTKVENNGASVYVGSSLTVHNLFCTQI